MRKIAPGNLFFAFFLFALEKKEGRHKGERLT
jgi:hypothetical protein